MRKLILVAALVALTAIAPLAQAVSIDVFPAGPTQSPPKTADFCGAFEALVTNSLVGSLPAEFQGLINALQPNVADINGTVTIDTGTDPTTITIVGNGILDAANELRLLERILKDANFNNGVLNHTQVYNAWTANLNQLKNNNMGASNAALVGSLVPGLIEALNGYVTIGGGDVSVSGTVTTATGSFGFVKALFSLVASAVAGVTGTPFTNPDLSASDFTQFPQLQVNGDADGDGATNAEEYAFFTHDSCGAKAADPSVKYPVAALDPNQTPGAQQGGGHATVVGPGKVEVGDSVELHAYTTGTTGTLTYEWQKDGVTLPNETGSSLILNPVTAEDAGVYRVLVTDQSKAVIASANFVLQVLPQGSLPVAGLLGMSILTGACALGGALGIRRKK